VQSRILFLILISFFLFNLLSGIELNNGSFRVFVFTDNIPEKNADLLVDGVLAINASEDGSFEGVLPEGIHYFQVAVNGEIYSSFKAPITPFLSTRIIVAYDSLQQFSELEFDYPEEVLEQFSAPKEAEKIEKKIAVTFKIISAETKKPVKDAKIYLRGFPQELVSDKNGTVSKEITVGNYSVSVIHKDFSARTLENVEVQDNCGMDSRLRGNDTGKSGNDTEKLGKNTEKSGNDTDTGKSGNDTDTKKSGNYIEKTLDKKDKMCNNFDIELTPASLELEEFVVLSPHIEGGVASLLQERKESQKVVEIIGAEQMSKSGDSDAAGALKRVAGISIIGGKYVYVRGMGQRYNCTLLNNSLLPSPEPDKKVTPLDIFPVGMLESMEISKTYSPDLPAEFGGGAVLLKTKGVPEKFSLKLSFSAGYKHGTTFQERLSYKGGAYDYLGFDDGTRALPEEISKNDGKEIAEKSKFSKEGFTPEEIEKMGESFENSWSARKTKAYPDMNFSASTGNSFNFFTHKLGFSTSILYSKSELYTEKNKKKMVLSDGSNMEIQKNLNYKIGQMEAKTGGILNLSGKFFENHKIESNTILLRTATDTAAEIQGKDSENNIFKTTLRWVEQQLFFEQLRGEHKFDFFKKTVFEWRYNYAQAKRDYPDAREHTYDIIEDTGEYILSSNTKSNMRMWSELQDTNHNFAGDLSLFIPSFTEKDGKIKVGGDYFSKEREVDTRRFQFQKGDKSSEKAEEIFSAENIGKDGWKIREITRGSDNYTAKQQISAAYSMIEMPLPYKFALLGGVRYEKSKQKTETYELYTKEPQIIKGELKTEDYFPAITISYSLTENMNIKTAYSTTISRPDFRELSPVTSSEVDEDGETEGNVLLKQAYIKNYDARWEWYFSTDESVSFGIFYKDFKNPIETVYQGTADKKTFQNAKNAKNYGLELDFRKNFGFLGSYADNFYISGNLSIINSVVQVSENSKERSLQGQSPYVVNLMLGYENIEKGIAAAFLYNVFGERIAVVGYSQSPDILEQPFHQLDFTYSHSIGNGFKIQAKAKNILDSEVVIKQGDFKAESYKKGREFSLGASWEY